MEADILLLVLGEYASLLEVEDARHFKIDVSDFE